MHQCSVTELCHTGKTSNVNDFYIFKNKEFEDQKFLNGERMISSENVWIPKYEEQVLAERRKKIEIKRIDKKVKNQEILSKIMRRFQIGDWGENQYSAIY